MRMETGVKITSRIGANGEKLSKAQTVGRIDIPRYDTLSEMVEALGGENEVLSLANTQLGTNLKNRARGMATAKVSDKKLRAQAENTVLHDKEMLQQIIDGEATAEELVELEMERVRREVCNTPQAVSSEEEDEEQ